MKKVMRKIIEIDEERCDGCGQCVPACAEGAIQVIDGKAKLVADKYCDGLGACLGDCPMDALHVIEREAEDFDEEAVEEYLKTVAQPEAAAEQTMACGCPSTQIQSFKGDKACPNAGPAVGAGQGESALTHWPIQIKLIPPTAPFLKGADLLILADCVGGAYAGLHRDLMVGRVVMMGCPKLDDARGLHREVHGGLQDGKTAQHHDRHDGGALLFRPLTHRKGGPEGIPGGHSDGRSGLQRPRRAPTKDEGFRLAGRRKTPICGVALIPPAFGGAGSVTAAYGVRLVPKDFVRLAPGHFSTARADRTLPLGSASYQAGEAWGVWAIPLQQGMAR